ncbi:MAG: hypothetical protein MUC94_15645 [bacterium]|jgi:hypothetical protein|nr:hypothetical protein [bacterium]
MSENLIINLAFEDAVHEAVLKKIFSQFNFSVGKCFSQGGAGYLKTKIQGFNHAARVMPFLVLADLDKIECAPILIKEWLPFPRHPNLLFRVAVREVESWILAHRNAFSKYLGINKNKIPVRVDDIIDPKQFLINLARRSRYKELREAIVPRSGSSAQQGPDYNGALITYVNDHWDVETAALNSPSLQKMINALVSYNPI